MLRINLAQAAELQCAARERDHETCAAGLVFLASDRDGGRVCTVRQLREVADHAYLERSAISASLRPAFCTEVANAAKAAKAGILLAHTHIGKSPLEGFSGTDNKGEVLLAEYFRGRLPGAPLFAAVFTGGHVYARELGTGACDDVVLVGRELINNRQVDVQVHDAYDRQVRAFGAAGQAQLATLRVAIVGLGGTGSIVAQQLAHLGVLNFVLVDPDVVDATNLNRLAGAGATDIGTSKVETAARHIGAINPAAHCTLLRGDVVDDEIARGMTAVDFIFCCTDSMASRAVLNQLAYQYFIPCIDMGVGIGASQGAVEHIAGRVQMLSPGLPCLVCTGKLDAEQVRRDMLTEAQRKADPYILGTNVPQPAVISLNGTVSSAAVTMFLAATTGIPSAARMLNYDGKLGTMKAVAMDPRPGCIACSEDGALGRANGWTLPTRRRA